MSNLKSRAAATVSNKNDNLRSGVWEYFTRSSNSAICQLCKSSLKVDGGSTKSLHTHLKSKHSICVLKRAAQKGEDDGEECNDTESVCVNSKIRSEDKSGGDLDDNDHGDSNNEYDDDTLEAAAESEGECDENEEGSGVNFEVDVCESIAELSPQYRTTINKVRNIVKMFRGSPTKNDSVLQKYVKEDHKGQELALILDCPTRWNSLIAMLNRFALLRTSIQKALIDLKIPTGSDLHTTDADFTLVNEMIRTLEPVALAVTVLSRRDVNLITAEAALQFCVMQLGKQPSELAKTMAMALRERISARYADHLRYLHNGDASSEFGENELSTTAIRRFICRLLIRLDCKPRLTKSSTTGQDAQGHDAPTPSCSTSTATVTGRPYCAYNQVQLNTSHSVTLSGYLLT